MKMTLNTVGFVEQIIGRVEGNKKNAVINAILAKSFLSGTAFESLIEHISQKEINKIQKDIEKMKKSLNITSFSQPQFSTTYISEQPKFSVAENDFSSSNNNDENQNKVDDIKEVNNNDEVSNIKIEQNLKSTNTNKQNFDTIKDQNKEVEKTKKVEKVKVVQKIVEKEDINKTVKKNLGGMAGFDL